MVHKKGTILNRPRFFNGNCVLIKELSEDLSKVDPVFRVPMNRKVRSTEHLYNAQVNFGKKAQDEKMRTELGDRTRTRGWLVLRTIDLAPNTSLPKPKKGWKITKLYANTDQEQEVDYLIEEVRHESPLGGRPLLIYVEFEENRERARRPGS